MFWRVAWKLSGAVVMLVLFTALAWAQFPGGGPPGGGGRPGGPPGGGPRGKGGNPFSPDGFFNNLSNGKDFITISEIQGRLQFIKGPLEEFAKNNGITDGKINKEQFTRVMDDMKKKMQSGQNLFKGGPPGGGPPGGGPPGSGTPPGQPAPSPGTAPPSKEDVEAKVKQEVDTYFERYDKNKDGFIQQDEMSKRLKEQWKEFDKDGDGKLSRAELTEYLRGFVEWRLKSQSNNSGNNNNDNKPGNNANTQTQTNVTTIDQGVLDERPVVYRAGNLPTGLPEWFYKLDLNGDGQIDLYEWRKGTEPLSKFDEWDRDGDGFITAEEVLFKQGVTTVSAQDDDSAKGPPGTAVFSAGNRPPGMNGFRPGGFGPPGGAAGPPPWAGKNKKGGKQRGGKNGN